MTIWLRGVSKHTRVGTNRFSFGYRVANSSEFSLRGKGTSALLYSPVSMVILILE